MNVDLSSIAIEFLMLYFVVGLSFLCLGAYWFIEGALSLSQCLKVPKLLIGSIVMSLATTSPEIIVSATAAEQGHTMIALGNILGSFMANMGLVLGVSGIIRPIKVSYIIVHRQIPFCIGALILLVVLSLGAYIELWEISILLALLVLWFGWLMSYAKNDNSEYHSPQTRPLLITVVLFILGALGMQMGSYLLVASAEAMAVTMNISPYVVGLSVVAIGTSLPELASGIYGAIRGEYELVLGNIIGANILLILLVLPVVVWLSDQPVVLSGSWGDYLFMGLASMLLWLFSTRFDRNWQINRYEAGSLLLLFVMYQCFVYRYVWQ